MLPSRLYELADDVRYHSFDDEGDQQELTRIAPTSSSKIARTRFILKISITLIRTLAICVASTSAEWCAAYRRLSPLVFYKFIHELPHCQLYRFQ